MSKYRRLLKTNVGQQNHLPCSCGLSFAVAGVDSLPGYLPSFSRPLFVLFMFPVINAVFYHCQGIGSSYWAIVAVNRRSGMARV